MRRSLSVVALALTAAACPAGPLPAGWAYQTRVTGDPAESAGGGVTPGTATVYAAPTGAGYLAAAFTPVADWAAAAGDRAVTAAWVAAESGATAGTDFRADFDRVTVAGSFPGGYTLAVSIRDGATGDIGEFAFRGRFGGGVTVPAGGDAVFAVTNTPDGPVSLTQSVGGTRYRVTLGDFPDLGPAGAGAYTASVELVGPAAETPEPAAVVLALGGLAAVAARRGWAAA